jgi:hypothetical protein
LSRGIEIARAIGQEQGRNFAEVIKKEVQKLEVEANANGLAAAFTCDGGFELITVRSFEFPTWNIAIIRGVDKNGDSTHRVIDVKELRLTGKLIKGPAKRSPIGFRMPGEEPVSSPEPTEPPAE